MANPAKTPETKSALKMPDEGSFVTPVASATQSGPVGRVEGLDYDKWAVAIVDLEAPAARVDAERARLTSKGYQKVEGDPMVGGFPKPEVWVIPRTMYEANRQRRAAKVDAFVASGQMMEFANRPSVVTRGR